MTRALLLLLALAACGGKKEAPPAPSAASGSGSGSGSGSAPGLGIVEPFKAGDDLPFTIDDIALHQKPSDAPPWYAPGGTFTYFTAHLTADPKATFVFGIPEDIPKMFAKAWLAPTSADAGARIVAAYAQVFSVPAPAAEPGARLAPLEIPLAALGDNSGKDPGGGFSGSGTWSTYKWLCTVDDIDGAEVFFNVSLAEKAGEWSEKDADSDEDIARCLAMALRDGVPAPRTPANDPTLATSGPTITLGKKLGDGTTTPLAVAPGRILTMSGDAKHGVVTSYDPATGVPTELYRASEQLAGGACNDTATVCALATVSRAKDRVPATADGLVLLAGGKATPVKVSGQIMGVWGVSPDGRWAVIGVDDGLVAISVKTQRIVALIQPGDAYLDKLVGWDGPGATARIQRRAGLHDPPTIGVWKIDHGATDLELAPNVQAREMPTTKPVTVVVAPTGEVTVVSEAGRRTMKLHPHDRGYATPDCCTWIDDRWLGMQTKRAYVFIDLGKLKVWLAPADTGEIRPVPFAHVALVGRDDGWYLATITPPP